MVLQQMTNEEVIVFADSVKRCHKDYTEKYPSLDDVCEMTVTSQHMIWCMAYGRK